MKKNTTTKTLASINPTTIRLISDSASTAVAGGATYTQLYYSCRACGSTTKFC